MSRADVLPDELPPRTLASLTRAAWFGWFVFTLPNVVAGDRPNTLALDVVVLAGTAGAYVLLRRAPRFWRLAMHLTATLSTVGLVLAGLWSGGVEAVAPWGLVGVPLFVSHTGGRRAGLAWSVPASLGAIVALLDPLGVAPEFVPTTADHVVGLLVLLAVCTAFGVLARGEVEERIASLTAAAKAKSELLATISHEIRTPLHGVLGIASVLGEMPLSADQRDLVTALRSSGKALNRIVDDVLDVARLEAGRLSIEVASVDLLASLEDLVDLYSAEAVGKGLDLVLVADGAEHFHAIADETRVKQIVSNLIGNAVKYTKEGSVVVRAAAGRRDDHVELVIRVEDTGPGIPAERMDRLFVAYDRLDTRQARLQGGTGLGLSLARDLALRMGGDVVVDRARKTGAAFDVTLHLPAAGPAPSRSAALSRPTALVVEADPAFAEGARSVARALDDVTLLVAESGAEALALARAHPVDVVVIGASRAHDASATAQLLEPALRPRTPLVLALSIAEAGVVAASPTFSGTTMRPLRRSRVRTLFEEAALVVDETRASPQGRTALIVDDDPTNRRILARLLEVRRWSVVTVESGARALTTLAGRVFDVVLCDLHMPDMDGIELVQRARESGAKGYFAVVTASVRESDRLRALGAGFDGFLRKPFEPAELDELLSGANRRAREVQSPAPVDGPVLLDLDKWTTLATLLADQADVTLAESEAAARGHIRVLLEHPEDVDAAERAAHTLGSSALMLGMRALGEAARALELETRDIDAEARRARGQRLATLLDRSFAALASARRTTSTSTSTGAGETPPASSETRVLRVTLDGHVDATIVETALERARRSAGPGPMALLVDIRSMAAYDLGARRAFEAWHVTHREQIRRVAFLTEDRLRILVIAAVSRLTGIDMQAFSSDEDARAWLGSGA